MILQIMVYATVVATALGVVGLCLERLATLRGLPRRTAWILSLSLSALLPLFMILHAEPVRSVTEASAARPANTFAAMPVPRIGDTGLIAERSKAQQPVQMSREWHLPQVSDRVLLWVWAVTSLLSGTYLLGANLRLRRRMSGWQHVTLLGYPVLVSGSMGPALVGVFRPRMVIPRWLLDEPSATQWLILEHELQHIAARDPVLVRAGVVLLAAMPWNLPLWWQWRRMRQAIELDCDARVLGAGAEPQSYGEVLLAISQRAMRMPSGVIAMSEPAAALERRIQSLLPDPVRHAVLQAMGIIALLVTGLGAAVAMDAPAISRRDLSQAMSANVAAAAATSAAPPVAIPDSRAQQSIVQHADVPGRSGGVSSASSTSDRVTQAADREVRPLMRDEPLPDVPALKPFGYDLFDVVPSRYSPLADDSVPGGYVIGAGDELYVHLFGGGQNRNLQLVVNREGVVNFPELGPIRVEGLTFSAAKANIEARVSRQMTGVRADVSVGNLRSINVQVLGEVRQPGNQTVKGLATITSVLFGSGGVTPIGSLRDIQLRRRGAAVRHLDLYDLLIRGDRTDDVRLQSDDVIFIPPVGPTVSVEGEVRRPAIYELRGEDAAAVLQMAGGLTPEADPVRSNMTRVDDQYRRVVLDLDFTQASSRSQPMRNGDAVRVARLRPLQDQELRTTLQEDK